MTDSTLTLTRPAVDIADRLTGLEERVTRIEATLAGMSEDLHRLHTILLSIGVLVGEVRS